VKKLHICRNDCDPSHKVWNKYYPDDPIFDGECIHHKDFNHDNNKKYNLGLILVNTSILDKSNFDHPVHK